MQHFIRTRSMQGSLGKAFLRQGKLWFHSNVRQYTRLSLAIGLGAFVIMSLVNVMAAGLAFRYGFVPSVLRTFTYVPSDTFRFSGGVGLPFTMIISNIVVSSGVHPTCIFVHVVEQPFWRLVDCEFSPHPDPIYITMLTRSHNRIFSLESYYSGGECHQPSPKTCEINHALSETLSLPGNG